MGLFFWWCYWGQFLSYSFPIQSIHFLFIPYWFLFISIYFLFIAYSFPFHVHSFLFIFYAFLFISYSFPFHFHSFLSFPLTWEILSKFQKAWIFFLINLLFKNYWFQAPNQLGKGVPHESQKKRLIKGVVNKVLDLDGLFISYSILIHFLFNSFSFPLQILFMSYSTLIEIPFIPIHFSAFHFQRFSIKVINKG